MNTTTDRQLAPLSARSPSARSLTRGPTSDSTRPPILQPNGNRLDPALSRSRAKLSSCVPYAGRELTLGSVPEGAQLERRALAVGTTATSQVTNGSGPGLTGAGAGFW